MTLFYIVKLNPFDMSNRLYKRQDNVPVTRFQRRKRKHAARTSCSILLFKINFNYGYCEPKVFRKRYPWRMSFKEMVDDRRKEIIVRGSF